MQVNAVDTTPIAWTGDALALGLFEGQLEKTEDWESLDERWDGAIEEAIEREEFGGESCQILTLRLGRQSPVRKLILVGLGKAKDFSLDTLRATAAAIARSAISPSTKTLAISLPACNNDVPASTEAIATGLLLALHQDNRFKSEPEPKASNLESIELLELAAGAASIAKSEAIASGVILARELVAAPANAVTPITLAETAAEIAREHNLGLEILEREDCEKLGMGSYLGVAEASDLPPKFIHLIYKPVGTPKRKLAIVGKGLTFDSGGLNIKPGSGMLTMKIDMGGAGATLGAAKAIAQLKPEVEVHFISAATENMISGRALRPGDILTASNGKTIEVNNTDAEGRLTLADALVYAEKLEVDAIVDLATLTGACVVALGNDIAGFWSSDETLAEEFLAAAETSGEKFWQMPLEERYFEGLKSPIADMKNTGPRPGGAITATLFLKQFVEKTPWIHLDVAGPVWSDKPSGANNEGATGFPVRTLINWVVQ